MVVLRARLTPEQGAIVQKALEAAADRLYQDSRRAAPPDHVAQEVTLESSSSFGRARRWRGADSAWRRTR